jgi:thioredoxin-dependent peroxiredoxin
MFRKKSTSGVIMTLKLGDIAPDFVAMSSEGLINMHDYIGEKWCVFFAHPKDFTPVCTTELGYMARMKHEFTVRNTKLLGISIDNVENHKRWNIDIADVMGVEINFPMIGDPDLDVSTLYALIHPNDQETSDVRTAQQNFTARSLFIIGPDKKIKFIVVYPMSTGRHFDEVLRVLDSLQLTAKHGVSTPAHWEVGGDVIIPQSLSNDDAKTKFPKGFKTIKPYLRYTPTP